MEIKPRVYIRNVLPERYILEIKQFCDQVVVDPWFYGKPEPVPSPDLSECNVILTAGFRDTLDILKKAPNIQWVQSTSVGVDKMLRDEIINSDLVITNTRGCTSVPIAEHTFALISALAKRLPSMIRNQVSCRWDEIPVGDLSGAVVGIIGYGDIGYEIAIRCRAFGMRVIGCRKNPDKSPKNDPAEVVGMDQLDSVLAKSDFVVLSLPSTSETFHLFNREKLAMMKPGSFLVNVGRGNTVVENDLIECLGNGQLAGAALDVFEAEPLPQDHPLWTFENVIVSPHRAYYSSSTLQRYMDLFMENLRLFSKGKPLLNVVNKKQGY
ncbi:D-2-hydroxyacid dehydrogenase [Sporolactobacillus sp. THM7-4]|nr:D-2-hydroxyacid dehydrogenase [Sporolactobacillus sp. THM7-4]